MPFFELWDDSEMESVMQDENWDQRTVQLLGDEACARLRCARVLVVGLGGVGATAAEMLCRAGVGHLTLVDGDCVRSSNINRQLPALHSTVGKPKIDIVADRLLDINPECDLVRIPEFLRDARTSEVLDYGFDYVADAIDTLSPKVHLIAECVDRGVPIVSSMGAGGKVDPAQIHISDLKHSRHCKLARVLRKRLRKLGVHGGPAVVFSTETVPEDAVIRVDEQNKKSTLGTISYIPVIFGCCLASVIVRGIVQTREK